MMTRFCTLVAASLLMPSLAWADPSWECSVDSSSQVETAECLIGVESDVNAVLEMALKTAREVAKQLDEVTERDTTVPALERAQNAWEAHRDAECDYVGARYAGGSGTGIAIRSCRITMTRARIVALQNSFR